MTDTAFSPKQIAEAARKAAKFFEDHPLERVQGMFAHRRDDDVQCFCATGRMIFELGIPLRKNGSGFDDERYYVFIDTTDDVYRSDIERTNDNEPITSEPPTETIAKLLDFAAFMERKS